MLLAFEEQEKSSSATAPSSPRPHHHSAKPSHPQIHQEHDQSGTSYGRLEELRQGSPLRSQDQEEPQQQQEIVVKAMEEEQEVEEQDNDDISDKGEREPRGEKRQHQDEAKEISSNVHNSEGGDHSHDTNDEDDEDLRPAKRRMLPLVSTNVALTPPCEYGTPRLRRPRILTPSSTTQPEMKEAWSQADHRHLPTLVDDDHHSTPQTSRSPSATAELAPVAEYREWPFQGFLKRTRIRNKMTYNLEFQLPCISERLNLPIDPEAFGISTNSEMSVKATPPHDVVAHSKVHLASVWRQIKRVRWTPEEDAMILKMREEDGCSWEDIHTALPHRTQGAIQV